jgi:hypothetical protein
MTRIWTPVDHLRKTPCSCDNCTNSYGMESETLLTLHNESAGKISVVLPDDLRLCELVDAAQPLDMPDGEGWWAFDGYVDEVPVRRAVEVKVETLSPKGELYVNDHSWYPPFTLKQMSGKFYRLQMSWQAQPSEEGDE